MDDDESAVVRRAETLLSSKDTVMRDLVLGLLHAEGRIRRLDAAAMASVRDMFVQDLDARLESDARRALPGKYAGVVSPSQ